MAVLDLTIDRRTLFHLSMLTLLGMTALGFFLISVFHARSVFETMSAGLAWPQQIVHGLAFGGAASIIAVGLIHIRPMAKTQDFFGELIKRLNPSFYHILFYSACAGIGEEILFRAALQPMMGIWLTSIIFVAIHGYLNPFNLPLSAYGLFLVLVCAGFGYLFEYSGIFAAIAAHFAYDVVMFAKLRYL